MLASRPSRCRRALAALLLLLGCGRGGGGGWDGGIPDGGPPPPPKTIDVVTVWPPYAEVLPGETFQFAAVVEGSEPDHRVTWSVTSPGAGLDPIGKVSADGLYAAPDLVPGRGIAVVATSVADPSRSGQATVVVRYALEVTPSQVSVPRGGTVQFHATVRGSADQGVVWSALFGRVDPSGLYTAPADEGLWWDQVTARAPQAGGVSGSATIGLLGAPPVLASSSGAATAGEVLAVQGTGFRFGTALAFPAAGGGELLVPATVVSPTEIQVKVPMGATSGPIVAEVADSSPARSNALWFVRVPRLRLWPARKDVAAGESVAISVAFLGGDAAPLAWSADRGAVQDGLFTAPAGPGADGYARVTACVAGTASCASVLLGVRPFRIEPAAPVVAAGQSVPLAAIASTGPVEANWRVAEGNGTFQGSQFVAPSRLADASRTRVVAEVGGAVQEAEVAVTGFGPGLVRRVNEHVDFREAVPRGTYAEQVLVKGSRAYVLATDRVQPWGSRDYFWLDVFDVSDPREPAWLGAVESLTHPDAMVVAGDHLAAVAAQDWAVAFAPSLALYDLGGSLPRPTGHAAGLDPATGSWSHWTHDGRWLYAVDEGAPSSVERLAIRVYDAASGIAAPVGRRDLALPRPSFLRGFLASGGRLFVGLLSAGYAASAPSMAVFDVSADPPVLLGEVDGADWPTQVIGSTLYAHPNAYDLTGPLPALVGPLQVTRVVEAPDGRAVEPLPFGVYVVDVSHPWAPERIGSMVGVGAFAWAGPWLLSAEGAGGLAVYDIAPPGGPLWREFLGGGICYGLAGNDLAVTGRYLYVAGLTHCGDLPPIPYGELAVYDLSSFPAAYLGSTTDYHNEALSLQPVGPGALAFVGHAQNLVLYDLSVAGEPAVIASTPLKGARLALRGTVLYAATSQGRLSVLDVASPSAPVEIGSAAIDGTPLRARLAGDLLLVALGDAGLAVYDVSFPGAPLLLSTVRAGGPIADALVVGDVALVSASEAGLLSVDLHDPMLPAIVGAVQLEPATDRFWPGFTPSAAWGLMVRDGLLYVGARPGLLHVFDVRDPRRPALVSHGIVSGGAAFDWYGPELITTGGRIDVSRPRNVMAMGAPDPALLR